MNFLDLIRRVALFVRVIVLRDPRAKEFKRWFDDRGDEKLRLSYALDKESVVFDVGGFKGDFAAAIDDRFKCRVHIFEPVPEYYSACVKRFMGNSRIHSHQFALSNVSGTFALSKANDGSTISAAKDADSNIYVQVRSVEEFIKTSGLDNISLMKINIEGGEFDLLPALIDSGLIEKVDNLQIQFHDFIPGAQQKREEIRAALRRTHCEQWCYPFVWESWSIGNGGAQVARQG